MQLSPAAQEILRQYKHRQVPELGIDLSDDERKALHQAERDYDARCHAEWAAARLIEVLDTGGDVERELRTVRLWALKLLRRGYLVKREWVEYSYAKALEMASRRTH